MIIDITREYDTEQYNKWKHIIQKYHTKHSEHIDYSIFPDAPYWGDGKNIATEKDDYIDGDYAEWLEKLLSPMEQELISQYKEKIDDIGYYLVKNGWCLHTEISSKFLDELFILSKFKIPYIVVVNDCNYFDSIFKIYLKSSCTERLLLNGYLRNSSVRTYSNKKYEDIINIISNENWYKMQFINSNKQRNIFKQQTGYTDASDISIGLWLNNNCNEMWYFYGEYIYFKDKADAALFKLKFYGGL
jgi:hypothetical protein